MRPLPAVALQVPLRSARHESSQYFEKGQDGDSGLLVASSGAPRDGAWSPLMHLRPLPAVPAYTLLFP